MKLVILTSFLAVNSLEDPHAYDATADDEIDTSAQPFTVDHNEDPPADAVKLTKEERKFFKERKESSGFRGAYLSEDYTYFCAENGKGTYEDIFTEGCKSYLSCWSSNFRPYRQTCWDGAMFDVNQKKCVWEIEVPQCAPNQNAFCVGKEKNTKHLDPADPTCNTYNWCLFRYEPRSRKCWDGAVLNVEAQTCKAEMDTPSCAPEEGAFCLGKTKYRLYVNPSDSTCKTYNECTNKYIPELHSCPGDKVFDPETKNCRDQIYVPECAPEGSFCAGKKGYTNYPNPADLTCESYFYCSDKYEPEKKQCRSNQRFINGFCRRKSDANVCTHTTPAPPTTTTTPFTTVKLPVDMENANEVFTAYSDRKLAKKILSHGCHCAMLSPVVGTYTEVRELGGAPIDALDALCRDFIQSRRCLVKSGGSCKDTGPGEVYEIGMIKNGDIYTGQCENNNTKTCSGAACMIDRFLADQTRNLDIDWRNFEPVKDAVCMKSFDKAGKNSCCGAWPNMALYNSATEKCVAGEIEQI